MAPPRGQREQAPRKPSRDELEYAYKIRFVERFGDVLTAFFQWGSLAFVAYCLYLSVDSLAGQDTFAKIGVSFIANMTVSKWAAYIFGAGGTIYGWNERRLRKNVVMRLGPPRLQYEQGLDPSRSSSGLTSAGETSREER